MDFQMGFSALGLELKNPTYGEAPMLNDAMRQNAVQICF